MNLQIIAVFSECSNSFPRKKNMEIVSIHQKVEMQKIRHIYFDNFYFLIRLQAPIFE